LSLEDDDNSGAGGASVDRLYHALGFELFDSCGLSDSGMVTASDAGLLGESCGGASGGAVKM
jgi:hypothetical protein